MLATVALLHDFVKPCSMKESIALLVDEDPTWQQENEALAKRFVEGINKAAFARDYKVPGGASMLSQHIMGRRPMNMSAALAYAHGFGVPLSEISPRLARQAAEATATAAPVPETEAQVVAWPFIQLYAARYAALTDGGRGIVDIAIAEAVERAEKRGFVKNEAQGPPADDKPVVASFKPKRHSGARPVTHLPSQPGRKKATPAGKRTKRI